MSVYLCADPGSCHDGLVSRAKQLIDVAADAGWDGIKFQLLPDNLVGKHNRYLDYGFLPDLMEYGYRQNIDVWASVWDQKGLQTLLNGYYLLRKLRWDGKTRIKFAHSQRYNNIIADACAQFDVVYVSCGLVDCSLPHLQKPNITRCFCVPEYPPPYSVNLFGFGQELGFAGFSDHTLGYETAVEAVQRGAQYIEKHIMLDSPIGCGDEAIALEPTAQQAFIDQIRSADDADASGKSTGTGRRKDRQKVRRDPEKDGPHTHSDGPGVDAADET